MHVHMCVYNPFLIPFNSIPLFSPLKSQLFLPPLPWVLILFTQKRNGCEPNELCPNIQKRNELHRHGEEAAVSEKLPFLQEEESV